MAGIYDYALNDIKGQNKSLGDYKGQVLLLVNVASRCGLTPQYKGLESLYEKYKQKGFSILAFPANDFGAQEPGSDTEIQQFCETNYGVTFPIFSKISVKGPGNHPLYQYLTTETPNATEIKWNFHKFLVDRKGQVIANIDPKTEPANLEKMIEELL